MFTDRDLMPFGKYKGEMMVDVPAKYLDWLRDQQWIKDWPDVETYIENNLIALDYEQENG